MREKIIEALRLREKDEKEEKEEKSAKHSSSEFNRIYGLLQNNIFNHAEIIEQLWGEKDATKRSLFRKKLNKMSNNQGGVYSFNEEELNKITSILMNTSNQIRKTLKGTDQ